MTEAALFYEAAAGGLGDDFLDDVQHAIDSVREHPSCAPPLATASVVSWCRFPFSIIYAIEPAHIVVVAVAHQRRAPDYWKGRA